MPILDCCHSGSSTRDVDAFNHLIVRQTHEVSVERPLDSYLDGYYARLHQKGEPLFIPTSKHILLAACERVQKAYETRNHTGVFTNTLVEVLNKSGSDIGYADLFVRCRSAVRTHAQNQTPQFETYKQFNAYAGFLGRETSKRSHRTLSLLMIANGKSMPGHGKDFPLSRRKTLAWCFIG